MGRFTRLRDLLTAVTLIAAVMLAAPFMARTGAQAITSAILFLGSVSSPTAVVSGNGVTGSGSPRVTIASDNTPVAFKIDQTTPGTTNGVSVTATVPGTAATNLGKAEDAASVTGDTGVAVFGVRNEAGTALTNADADYGAIANDAYGVLYTRQDHPKRFHCIVTVSTATTIQAVGSPCAAPGAGLSLYVTDVYFSASASGIGADAFPTLKYGTGGTCGSGTTVFWQALTAAAVQAVDNRSIPIKIPANNEICWITSTAGSKAIQVSGFIAQ